MTGPRSTIATLATLAEVGAGATWVGASAGFAFISAPLAFVLISDRNVFAELTERSLARLSQLTYVCAGITTAIAFVRCLFGSKLSRSDLSAVLAGGVALTAIAYHQFAIVPAMTHAQAQMGGTFDATHADDPARIAYRKLHRSSTRVFGTALLSGIVQLGVAATRSSLA